ncbi:MAG: hypothetical protein GWM92_05225, partial [Gemmatimonadetes bacterium]|nr:hypothetical protein [Gemmatimonadota bacterium]NIR78005.1 hypothetical protein [Gemmatimonadota bacterium]NIT86540.1 hypothetical protein [Gemmatimonadota bacterium]NIU30402.1 hypothetical protein [Gemmatimonadota bacterium]NIU35277.1 hypothetical protein [Gemmatimonadota bacterium]
GIRLYLWSRRAPFPENPQLGRHVLGLLLLAMPLYLLWGAALRSSLRWLDGRSELRRARFALILALGYGAYIAAFALWVGRG